MKPRVETVCPWGEKPRKKKISSFCDLLYKKEYLLVKLFENTNHSPFSRSNRLVFERKRKYTVRSLTLSSRVLHRIGFFLEYRSAFYFLCWEKKVGSVRNLPRFSKKIKLLNIFNKSKDQRNLNCVCIEAITPDPKLLDLSFLSLHF